MTAATLLKDDHVYLIICYASRTSVMHSYKVSGVPFRGRPVLNAIRIVSRFSYAPKRLMVDANLQLSIDVTDNCMSMKEQSLEMDYKTKFCLKYFGKTGWRLDVEYVDVRLETKAQRPLLYIEAKERISSDGEERRKAIAQALLTNKKQTLILGTVGILYYDTKHERDMLEIIDCSDNDVMFCPEVKWDAEKPSNPSNDAVNHLNNRVADKITTFKGDVEITSFWKGFKKSKQTAIKITAKNSKFVYDQWRAEVKFKRQDINEQELIDLFLADMLNKANYKEKDGFLEQDLIRNNTNLSLYDLQPDGIAYKKEWYAFADRKAHDDFWKRYYRPPVKEEFLKIKEHSNELYSDGFRRSTGQEYTPSEFVRLQNELIKRHYDIRDFIVFDPCAGVGNLEIDFGRDYRDCCYLSTLLDGDVDQCKFKKFNNSIQYDYMKNWQQQPRFPYKGDEKTVREIAELEGKKLMVVMNPPFVRPSEGFRYDRCIEFFRKVLQVNPDVIVYYCKTEFFFRAETNKVFADSGYKVVEHVISNAKETFKLSVWPISLVIFDRNEGENVTLAHTHVNRYEPMNGEMVYKADHTYDNKRPDLIEEFETALNNKAHGLLLGQWTNDRYCVMVSNQRTHDQYVTTENLRLALTLKGINFNTHPKYYETRDYIFRGRVDDVSPELANDAIIHALFHKGNAFSNKEGVKNYLMPFTAQELGCGINQLYVLAPKSEYSIPFPNGDEDNHVFDFRKWMQTVKMSAEGQAVYDAALEIVRYYHNHPAYAEGRDWNDGFYDIKNAIMEKDATAYQKRDTATDRRLTRVKTATGARGFSQINIRKVTSEEYWPMFDRYFEAKKTLAEKILQQLTDAGLLLWKPSNVY